MAKNRWTKLILTHKSSSDTVFLTKLLRNCWTETHEFVCAYRVGVRIAQHLFFTPESEAETDIFVKNIGSFLLKFAGSQASAVGSVSGNILFMVQTYIFLNISNFSSEVARRNRPDVLGTFFKPIDDILRWLKLDL